MLVNNYNYSMTSAVNNNLSFCVEKSANRDNSTMQKTSQILLLCDPDIADRFAFSYTTVSKVYTE